jgi:hypothetical protein
MTFFVCALCWSSISLQNHCVANENLKNEKEYISYILISVAGFSVTIVLNTTTVIHENNTQQNAQHIK